MTKRSTKNAMQGFTLVELILYIALVSLFLGAAVLFSWDVIYGREKSFRQQVVQQSARIAMSKIGYEIKRAVDVNSVSANQIVLNNGATTTTINLSAGRVRITSGGVGPYNITSNQVVVTNLTFTNLIATNENTKNIKVSMILTQANAPSKGELVATTQIDDSFELNSEFNEARRLLVSTSLATLAAGGTTLQGMAALNTEAPNLVIDKMFVSWSGVPLDRRITSVQLGTGTIEWTGTAASGTLLELANHTVTQASGSRVVTMTFNLDMTGGNLNYYFVMRDGSFARAEVPLYVPTFNSCEQICQSYGYVTNWICRGSLSLCTTNGEVNISTGNQYCSGGANADTCCCE